MNITYHFIGIGGIGMSGLAHLLLQNDVKVSGSDLKSNPITQSLINCGARVHIGHSTQAISRDMTVIYSSGVQPDNPEYRAAVKLKCQMLHRSDLLLALMQQHKSLTITGTHGKTTTSALLTTVLKEGGLDPAFAIGGILPQYDTNAVNGQGEFFVAEADESDGTFLKYQPHAAIITNIGRDHLDHYAGERGLLSAFKRFCHKKMETLLWCGDDPALVEMAPSGISYGFSQRCHLRAKNYRQEGWKIFFDISFEQQTFTEVEVALVGKHNALNALAVFGLAKRLGVSEEKIRTALMSFGGVKRRCELKWQQQAITLIDDYAHHPTEIQTTLEAIRAAIKEKRLIVIYQPHRYSRTQSCLGAFKQAFNSADQLLITEIYSAGEKPIEGITSEAIVKEVAAPQASVVTSRETLAHSLSELLRPHDVVVTLGAGDITLLSDELLLLYKKKVPIKSPWGCSAAAPTKNTRSPCAQQLM